MSYTRLVLVLVLSLLLFSNCQDYPSDTTKNCVKTHENLTNSSCHTLGYYMRNRDLYFKSYSEFYFEPGVHFTELNASLVVSNVSNLLMVGLNAIIACNNYGNYFHFDNVHGLKIEGLNFSHCGKSPKNGTSGYAALSFVEGDEIFLSIAIHKAEYQGLLLNNIYGNTTIVNSHIEQCHAKTNDYLNSKPSNAVYYSDCNLKSQLYFQNTTIARNKNIDPKDYKEFGVHSNLNYPPAGLFMSIKCPNVNIVFDNITADNSTGGNGGNIAIFFVTSELSTAQPIIINNSQITNGIAINEGGGIYLLLVQPLNHTNDQRRQQINHPIVIIENSHFINNSALMGGGAISVQQKGSGSLQYAGDIVIKNCTFTGNSLIRGGHGGIAINYLNFIPTQISHHFSPQFEAFIINCTFNKNHVKRNLRKSAGTSVIFIKTTMHIKLQNVDIYNNIASGILGLQSNIVFGGNVTITGNEAESGGGILLCQNAVLYLEDNVHLTVAHNHAHHTGGGIAVESICVVSKPICFFQFVKPEPREYNNITITLYDNNASYAGHNLYGGSVDYCYLIESPSHLLLANHSLQVFEEIFDIYPKGPGMPYVTSKPDHACICVDKVPHCNITTYLFPHPVYPGQPFYIEVILAGQLDGSVPGYLKTELKHRHQNASLSSSSKVHRLSSFKCKRVRYEIYSYPSNITMSLGAVQQGDTSVIKYLQQYRKLEIVVAIKNCPKGFSLQENKCICKSFFSNSSLRIRCHIKSNTISVPQNAWIGYFGMDSGTFITQDTYALVGFCPSEYCESGISYIYILSSLNKLDQDSLCKTYRQGILCGQCIKNHSVTLGGNECKLCSNNKLGFIALYALVGIVVVFLLTYFDITVADGTINGFIFYANIIRAHYNDIFILEVKKHAITMPISVLLGWLSLENGVEQCFYNGMTEYQKAWLSFVFPFYMWLILGVIVLLSRRYAIVMRMIGQNAVKVFATLIILSYTSIMSNIIIGLDSTIINLSNGKTHLIWTKDGSIEYFGTLHLPLFIFCVCLSIICIPLTIFLLFIQILERYSHFRILFLVRKFKPLLDAYTGPYVDGARFWTGFLLLIRICVFCAATLRGRFHTGGNLEISITLLLLTLSVAFVLRNGVYKKRWIQIIEASLLFNLASVLIASEYIVFSNQKIKQLTATIVSILMGIALLNFGIVIVYHVLKKLYSFTCFRRCLLTVKEQCWRRSHCDRIRPLDENSIASRFIPPIAQFTEDREPLLAN